MLSREFYLTKAIFGSILLTYSPRTIFDDKNSRMCTQPNVSAKNRSDCIYDYIHFLLILFLYSSFLTQHTDAFNIYVFTRVSYFKYAWIVYPIYPKCPAKAQRIPRTNLRYFHFGSRCMLNYDALSRIIIINLVGETKKGIKIRIDEKEARQLLISG